MMQQLIVTEKEYIHKTFDTMYQECVRPIFLHLFTQMCIEITQSDTVLLDEVIKQKNNILTGKKFRVSRKVKNYLTNYLLDYLDQVSKQYKDIGYTINVLEGSCYISHVDKLHCTMIISLKQQLSTGLTELLSIGEEYTHFITFTNPCIEFYVNMLSLYSRPLVYIFKNVVYEYDSIFMHELQHAKDDVLYKLRDKTRTNEYYSKILRKRSDYYFKRYVTHPVELVANIQQIAYYIHTISPKKSIDAIRFYRFFQQYKHYKYACTFKRTEINKYLLLFKHNKEHRKQWFVYVFKLLNFKYIHLYGTVALHNVKECLNLIPD